MRKVSLAVTLIIPVLCVTSVSTYTASSYGPLTHTPHGQANVTHGPSTPSTHATTTTTKTSTPTSGTLTATHAISPIAQKAAAAEATEAEHDADRDVRAGSTTTTSPSSGRE